MKRYWKLILLGWASVVLSCESVDVIYDVREQLQLEQEIIDQYILENDLTAFIDPSGIRYQVLEEGESDPRSDGDILKFNSRIRRLDGGTFETDSGIAITDFSFEDRFELRSMIKDHRWQCLHEAARHIGKEGRILMYVPSVLALRNNRSLIWGEVGGRSMGVWMAPNTPLILEAQLIEIN